MPDEPAKPIDVSEVAADLERRTEQERVAGAYADANSPSFSSNFPRRRVCPDLARQTDTAIRRVESALAVEIAARERLEGELRHLEERLAEHDQETPRAQD